MHTKLILTTVFLVAVCFSSVQAEEAGTPKPWQRENFQVNGRAAFVVLPSIPRRHPLPWVLYAPTFDKSLPNERDEGWMVERFLQNGIALAGVDVGESYGSPAGRDTFSAFHRLLVKQRGFDPHVCLLARSRGGLMAYCWAVENPHKVRCVAGIYPVCDIASYPGLAKACHAYGMTESELSRALAEHNPISRLEGLAKADVPIFHIHGDIDNVVPLLTNSMALRRRYKELGGTMNLVIAKGQGHNMWSGFFRCQELVDFVVENATIPVNKVNTLSF